MRIIGIILTILAFAMPIQAESGAGGTTSPFNFGAGSRDLALSGADVSSCDFATAAFWNPSRLAQAEQFSLLGFHCRLFDSDVAYQYLGIVAPTMDWGTIGVGVFRLGIDNIERRDAQNVVLGSFDDNRMAYRLAYGRSLGVYNVGASLTLESHSLDSYRSISTPGVDLSVSRTFRSSGAWIDDFQVSLVAHNVVSPSMRLVDQTTKYPTEIQVGASAKITFGAAHSQWLEISGKMMKADETPSGTALGLEYSLFDMLKLRSSIHDNRMSFGAGLSYHGIGFDYAAVNRDLGNLQLVTITTTFGKPVTERKKIRTQRREAAFTKAMNDRLDERNRSLAKQLIEQGKKSLDEQDIAAAYASFDRALFLSRAGGFDTAEVAVLAENAHNRMIAIENAKQLSIYLDSAATRFAAQDYLGCQSYATLALGIDSTSAEGQSFLRQAHDMLAQFASQKEFVQKQVWMIDSLLNYGFQTEALTLARTLSNVLPSEPLALLALKKAEFEYWKSRAADLFAKEDYPTATGCLDSALMRFPDQQWCMNLKKQCQQRMSQAAVGASHMEEPAPTLSREILKAVANWYGSAQEAFQRGDLQAAIMDWEKVEKEAPNYQSVREYLVKAYRFVGVELYGKNQLQDAMTVWKKALMLAPDNAEIAAYAKRTQNEIEKLKEMSLAR
jgi:tetratricopeptide (TPR) repeat protein